jgi:nuclear transport factor 2 (NTF2) superfamily protein
VLVVGQTAVVACDLGRTPTVRQPFGALGATIQPFTAPLMIETKVRFHADDLQHLDQQAAAVGKTRSAFIRDRALARLTTAEYHRLVSAVARRMHGDLNRRQVETVTAFVVNEIHRITG